MRWTLAVGALFLLLPLIAVSGGLALPAVMALATIFAFSLPALGHTLPRYRQSLTLLAFSLVWALATSVWTLHSDHGQAFRLAGTTLVGVLFVASVSASAATRNFVRVAGVVSIVATSALLALEMGYGMPINRAAQPDAASWVVARNPGRGAAMLTVLLWGPLAATLRLPGTWRVIGFAALALGAGATLTFSQMDANAVAFAFGCVAFVGGALFRGSAILALFTFWTAWLCLAPTLAPLLLPAGLADDPNFPSSWGHRALIWSHTSQLIADQPLLGHGLDSSRAISDQLELRGRMINALPLHPHSASLQIWLELGAVGVVLGAATLMLVATEVARKFGASRAGSAAVCGTVAAFGLFSNVSFGVWQEWWICTGFLAIGLLAAGSGDQPPFDQDNSR